MFQMGWLVQLNHQLDGNEEMGSEKTRPGWKLGISTSSRAAGRTGVVGDRLGPSEYGWRRSASDQSGTYDHQGL